MKKSVILSIGLVALTLMGCSSDNAEQQTPGQSSDDRTPMTLVSYVSTRGINTELQRTQIAESQQVGVFAKTSEGLISSGDNAMMVADGQGNFVGNTIYFPHGNDPVSVYAYAPYSSAWNDMIDIDNDFSVQADQSTDASYLQSDLLHGIPAGTNAFTEANPTVALNFTHKLSKLTIKFKAIDDINLQGTTINIVNTLPTTTLNVESGELGEAKGTATNIKAATFAADATTFVASAVIVPQTVAAGSFIQVVLTDGRMLNAQLNSPATFLSGKSYTYNVNVNHDGAVMELTTTVTDWDDNTEELTGDVDIEDAPEVKLYATFGTPASNATYEAPVYSWTGSTNNLMNVFTFNNGELANYKALRFQMSNLSEGAAVRMLFFTGSDNVQVGRWDNVGNGEIEIDFSTLSVDLSKVTRIAFGGSTSEGSVEILAEDMYLVEGSAGGTTEEPTDEPSDEPTDPSDDTLYATFGTPASNASYTGTTYSWTGSTSNLMTVFEFNAGELANYKSLVFTFSNLDGAPVRAGYYVGSEWKTFGSFYSNGTKGVDLTALGIDLSTVTKICFGGNSSAGSCTIKASDVYVSKKSKSEITDNITWVN